MYQREVVLHAPRGRSLRCWRAKRLLKRAGYHFELVEVSGKPPSGVRKRLAHGRSYRQTVPYLFVGGARWGGGPDAGHERHGRPRARGARGALGSMRRAGAS